MGTVLVLLILKKAGRTVPVDERGKEITMGKRFVSMLLVVVLVTGMLPVGMMPNIKAASLLTFEAAQKYEGIIAAEESRISVLQEDGTVKETNLNGAKSGISEWEDIALLASGYSFTAGIKQDGTVI